MHNDLEVAGFDAFVSYSTKDKVLVDALVHFLEENKIRCRYAGRDFVAGVPYPEQIVRSIEKAKVLLFVLSANSSASDDCCRELEVACRSGCVIVPFKVDETSLVGTVKYYLQNIHWIEAFPKPEEYFGELSEQVRGVIERGCHDVHGREPSVEAKGNDGATETSRDLFSRFTEKQKSFWRYFAERRSKQMKVIVSDIECPTIKDLISSSKVVYKDKLDICNLERAESPSIDQFIRVCEIVRSAFERSAELGDGSIEFCGILSSGFELLGRFPRGAAGRYNSIEVDRMFEKVHSIFEMMGVLYEDAYNVASACGVAFECPLLLQTIPKDGSPKDLIFAKSGDGFRFRKSIFVDMAEKYRCTEETFLQIPPETPVDFFFDPEFLYYQILVSLNDDASFPAEPYQLQENARLALRDPAVQDKMEEVAQSALKRCRDSLGAKESNYL